MLPTQLLPSLLGLPTEEHVDLLFDPVFVIRLVCLCISSVNQTAEVCQIVNKIKQLADIVCDGRAVGIHPLQMFFIHFTNTCGGARERKQRCICRRKIDLEKDCWLATLISVISNLNL